MSRLISDLPSKVGGYIYMKEQYASSLYVLRLCYVILSVIDHHWQ